MNKGTLYGIGAYFIWGLFPIYWKLIKNVPAVEIIGHRMVWSFVFVMLVIIFTGKWKSFSQEIKDRKKIPPFLLTALLLSVNWFTYVWAVNSGYIVETSLGYFINPLVNVLLGVVFLQEHLRKWQWISVMLAALGIVYLTWLYGSLPWIAITLALSFAFYGFIKKKAALSSTQGFAVETGVMILPALAYLLSLEISGKGAFGNQSMAVLVLLVLAGVATGFPLLLFGAAARQINLSTLGFLQYIAPTLQLLIGVLVYHEAFQFDKLIGFGLIWIALLIFSVDGLFSRGRVYSAAVMD